MGKYLITGSRGFLGKKLMKILSASYDVVGIDKEVEITNYDLLYQNIHYYQPTVIIHTAGIPDPDYCEKNRFLSYTINVIGTANLVTICRNLNIKLIFISTDYVFSGKKPEYMEMDMPDPINFYGWTKYWAEDLVRTLNRYLIIRTNILYGFNDYNDRETFVTKIINNKNCIYLDDCQVRYPLLIDDLAQNIIYFLENDTEGIKHIRGIYEITKYAWAHLIDRIFNLNNTFYYIPTYKTTNRPTVKLKISEEVKNISGLYEGLELMKKQMEEAK